MSIFYLTLITKTWHFFMGTFCWNTLAKRKSPLPLLLVHSGKTTSGFDALCRISSRDNTSLGIDLSKGGTKPVIQINLKKDTCRNPRMGMRGGVLVVGWCLTELKPERRPGVRTIGVACWGSWTGDSGIDSGIGITKIGLNLGHHKWWVQEFE